MKKMKRFLLGVLSSCCLEWVHAKPMLHQVRPRRGKFVITVNYSNLIQFGNQIVINYFQKKVTVSQIIIVSKNNVMDFAEEGAIAWKSRRKVINFKFLFFKQ